MEKLIAEYQKMILRLHSSKNEYVEEDLVIFSPARGRAYNTELMVYGRAVNDWKNYFHKHNEASIVDLVNDMKSCLENDNLDWVLNSWGINDGEYNTKRSAFWRAVWKLSEQFSGDDKNPIDTIVWSNLYKVAPSGGGNPSTQLKNVQFDSCLELVRLELEIFKPQYVVFFTDYYGWVEPFVKGLPIQKIDRNDEGFIKFIGTYNGSNIVVAQHPQGKPEDEHIEAIMKANERFKNNINV